jgi:hypothetical protein
MKLSAIVKTLTALAPIVSGVVRAVKRLKITGADKFETAAAHIGVVLDEAFDGVPEWSDIGEDRRDTIIAGLVELAVFLHGVGKSQDLKVAIKRLRKA